MCSAFRCSSVREFNEQYKLIHSEICTAVDHVYNLGNNQYYEYPLFLVTSQTVFRLYFSDGEFSLQQYPRTEFSAKTEGGIFRESAADCDFDYIHPESYQPNSSIYDVVPIKRSSTSSVLKGVDILFSDGKRISLRESALVDGGMDSCVE